MLGGGSGRISKLLIENGYQNISLFDKSKNHVLGAKNIGVSAECCDFFDFHTDELFDVILANEVTQFIPIGDLISFSKKYLKEDGLLIFVYLNPKSWRQLIKTFLVSQKKGQTSYITPVKLNNEMKNSFKLIENIGYMWQVAGSHSNNYSVIIFAILEKYLFLNKWIKRSPWILTCYGKK